MPMRKIIATGETILDIVFRDDRPVAAVPGGSAYNAAIAMGRAGLKTLFVGDTGADTPGRRIRDFAAENGVSIEHFHVREDVQTALSLAYLDAHNDAHYEFYKPHPTPCPGYTVPQVEADDVVLFGSYYAIAPAIRPQVLTLLEQAHAAGAILYYDLNFRRSHRHELDALLPAIHRNFELATIVRGSADDFEIMYGLRDARTIYERHIAPHCPLFLCTDGGEGVTLCTPHSTLHRPVEPVRTVSNVGAGDNFNAGFIYALVRHGVGREALTAPLSTEEWSTLIDSGCHFAANVCASLDNYISPAFAATLEPPYSSRS